MSPRPQSLADHPDGEVRIDGLTVRSDEAVALTPLPRPALRPPSSGTRP